MQLGLGLGSNPNPGLCLQIACATAEEVILVLKCNNVGFGV